MEAKLCFIGHGLMGNCSGLIVDVRGDPRLRPTERLAAGPVAITPGADKSYDAADFVEGAAGDECAAACGAEYEPATLSDRQA